MAKNKANTFSEQELIIKPKLRAEHMNRIEVLDRVGDLQLLPNINLATTKQVAEFYSVEPQLISLIVSQNQKEVHGYGVEKTSYSELKESLFAIAGNGKEWTKLSRFYGISSSYTKLYSRKAVLNIGFLLEESVVAMKIRSMVKNTGEIAVVEAKPDVMEPKPNNTVSNEIVAIQNNQAVTTSLQISKIFGKRHDNVLRDIEALEKDVLNFEEMFYEGDIPDSYGRPRKAYYMNRDGFTLLAMGFTGKKAMKFKLEYINQFNQMEKQLKSQVVTVASYMINDPIKRAEQWIAEQKEVALLAEKVQEQVEVITHKQDVIEGLTENISLADKRQILNKVVRSGCYNSQSINNRWSFLYDQFEMKHHINVRVRRSNYNRNMNKKVSILDFIEDQMSMFDELYELAIKLFENDANEIIKQYKEVLVLT